MSASFVKREVTCRRLGRRPKNNSEDLYTSRSMSMNSNILVLIIIIIQSNPYLFTCKLNGPDAIYKASASKKNQQNTRKQNKNKEVYIIIILIISLTKL
jgi:hypothetical protein